MTLIEYLFDRVLSEAEIEELKRRCLKRAKNVQNIRPAKRSVQRQRRG